MLIENTIKLIKINPLCFLCCFFFHLQLVQAVAFDPALKITAAITLDSASIPTAGTATQTAIYSFTQAGVINNVNINNLTATSLLPATAVFADINDNLEIKSQSTGDDPNAHSGLLTDLTLILQNTSTTKTFSVRLEIQTDLQATVNGADVAADAKTTLQKNGINLINDKEAKADVALGLPSDISNDIQSVNIEIQPLQTAHIMGNIDIIADTNLLGSSLINDHWVLNNTTKITILVSNGLILPPVVPIPVTPNTNNATPVPLISQNGLLILSLLFLFIILLRKKALNKKNAGKFDE